jgi:hypothetical protein
MKRRQPTYSLIQEMFASDTDPMPQSWREHTIKRMRAGLDALERGKDPSTDDWRLCSDAVNMVETLVDDLREMQDPDGLLMDAITALALAGKRNLAGKKIRLDGPGIIAMRSLLDAYQEAVEFLPARIMIRAHRRTERRLWDIQDGRRRPRDVEVVKL